MHAFANPARFLRMARPITLWLVGLGGAMMLAAIGWGVLLGPPDYLQGETVRIIYVHVPAAWLGMAGWTGIAVASAMHIIWRHPLAGIAGRACAVPGAVFAGVCLATGSIWGRPAWGTWWEWDGRLTSMLVLFFLYLGYIALANAEADDPASEGRMSAIFGLVGAVNLPIVHFSVQWWNTLHQGNSVSFLTASSTINGSILWPLLIAALGANLLFAGIVLMRMRTALAITKADARMRRLAAQ